MKTYLGDSVYAEYDGYGHILTTENGDGPPSNLIYLEPQVYDELVRYVEHLGDQKNETP